MLILNDSENAGSLKTLASIDGSKTLRSIEVGGILHYGTPRHSGRYPWGSGENPYQSLRDWKSYISTLKKSGMTMEEIAASHGMTLEELKESTVSTSQKRQMTTIKNAEATVENVARAWELKNKGYSNVAIAESMGVSEGSIRNWLKPGADEKAKQIVAVSDVFRDAVDKKGVVDVGGGVENYLGISKTRMDACIRLLQEEGYNVYYDKVKQAGTGEFTSVKALCPPDMSYKDFKEKFSADPSIVQPVGFYAEERNGEVKPVGKPTSISRDRIMVRWGDEAGPDGTTGSERDGTIQLRPGVEDLDLMGSKYAQCRIAVDDKMYMKGVAVYGDPKEFPDGVDVIYNVNRPKGSPDLADGVKEGVFKKMYKKGEDDAFGASTSLKSVDEETGDIIYQKTYIGKDGKQQQSAINIVNDQGAWEDWDKTLPSQFLSKQSPELAKQQLGIVSKSKQDEFDEIMSLNNPTVKKKMLDEFADSCDSAAVNLKAAALPRQKTQVLVPIPSMKNDEVYAPNFRDGESVVLVRFPYAGTFESPELKVNNKNAEAIRTIGKTGVDAIGINATVASKMSGADFDGDSVIVIPNNDGRVKTSETLKGLKNFDPKVYTLPEGSKELDRKPANREREKQIQMGIVSNLITDMTIKGCSDPDEYARAVRHSMVVIDCVKHNLDWKQSEKDNRIQELKDKYQANEGKAKGGGSSTIVSRAKSPIRIEEEKPVYATKQMSAEDEKRYKSLVKEGRLEEASRITGLTSEEKKRYDAGEVITRKTGRTKMVKAANGSWVDSGVKVTKEVSKMAATKDARTLSSGTLIEEIYADHANTLKSLANQARAASRATPKLEQSPSAKEVYKAEIESLKAKVLEAEKNRPVERQAQLIQSAVMKAKVAANPDLKEDRDAYKKAEQKALTQARTMTGAGKQKVNITDREWEAIQAGAISDNMLMKILNNTDMDVVKKRATPRASTGLSDSTIARAKGMAANGMSQAEIADALGISTSTVSIALK